MTFVNVEFSACRNSGEAVPDQLPIHSAAMCALRAQREAQNFAAEVDRNSIWPTHRIRSFLLSQHYNESWAEAR